MIGAVLRKGTDYAEFEALLIQQGYTYTPRFKRIFYIECNLEDFAFRDHVSVESCTVTPNVSIEPQEVDVLNPEVFTLPARDNNPNLGFYGDHIHSWGPHRIIRRDNPFTKTTAPVVTNHSLQYRSKRTGSGVDIYVLDAGFRSSHREFAPDRLAFGGGLVTDGAVVGDTDFIDTTNGTGFRHGQQVAACAGGNHNGIARDSQLWAVAVEGRTDLTEMEWVGLVEIAYDHYMTRTGTNRPAVVCFSYGSTKDYTPSPAATAAYDDIFADGLIVCIAAANKNYDLDNTFLLPAETHEDIVVVGATDAFDLPMSVASSQYRGTTGYGSGVDLYAPGYYLVTADILEQDHYALVSGTSFATPYTAGVIACMLEGYQRLTSHAQVKSVIQKLKDNSTKDILRFGDAYFGDGIINNRLLYLDPDIDFEEIEGLTPL